MRSIRGLNNARLDPRGRGRHPLPHFNQPSTLASIVEDAIEVDDEDLVEEGAITED